MINKIKCLLLGHDFDNERLYSRIIYATDKTFAFHKYERFCKRCHGTIQVRPTNKELNIKDKNAN